MKKTTTRLASTTAVIVMSAFAILLAQHDARKTSQVEDEISTSMRMATEPPMPLAVDQFSGGPQVVRGNNDGAIDDRMTGYDNPLRDDQFATAASLADLGNQLLGGASGVVAASGEAFAEPYQQTGTAPQLQPLPSNLNDSFPALGSFGPANNSAPVNNSANSANSASSASSVPNLPGNNGSSATQPAATQPAATARLSDTQSAPAISRNSPTSGQLPGAQLPATQLPATQLPAAQLPSGQLPSGLGGTVGSLPSTSSSNPNAVNSSGLPAATSPNSGPGTARLGVPTAPPPVNSTASQGLQNSRSASMSDTQRGAMLPTQLSDQAAVPAYGASGAATTGSATYGNTQQPNIDPRQRSEFSTASQPMNSNNTFTPNYLPPAPNAGANSSQSSMTPLPTGPAGLDGSFRDSQINSGPSAGFNSRSQSNNALGAVPAGGQVGFSDNSSVVGARATLVSNQPGSRFLDGSQNPAMQIQKRAPEEVTVGKKASFVIVVRNAGNAAAHDVTVVDRVPRGSRFAEASPGVTPTADGVLVWKLGEMGPGDEKTINLQIIPEVEGEVGSIASVHIAAQASVRSMATAPQIDLQVDGSAPIIIGQGQEIHVNIRNSGTGVARGIRLEADIPGQLKHESGENQLQADLGDIRPGESRRLSLNVAAIQPGQSVCPLRAVNEDGVQAQGQFSVDVRAPKLVAAISGPAKRYLERQATYQIVVNNTGTAMARNLYFDVHLPIGLKFVSADIAQATYHPESHSVTLGLAELNAGANAAFAVSVLPVELGPQNIRFNANADLGISAEAKGQMTVEGLSELAFTIGQDNGTVEVGATTTYAVQVSNVGNQSDKNVQLLVQLPEGAKLVKVDSPVDHREENGRLVFAAVGEMRSRDVKTFRFQVQHQRAGNQVVRAQLTSTNWPVAVLKEEGTLVYNDQ